MEMANEYVSRRTLPEFMESLGGKLENPQLITDRKSTGYNTMVRNYQRLIEWTGADKDKVLEAVQKHLFEEDYNKQAVGLQKAIEEATDKKIKGLKGILQKAREQSEPWFDTYLKNNEDLLKAKGR
jgi:hypothetical protein